MFISKLITSASSCNLLAAIKYSVILPVKEKPAETLNFPIVLFVTEVVDASSNDNVPLLVPFTKPSTLLEPQTKENKVGDKALTVPKFIACVPVAPYPKYATVPERNGVYHLEAGDILRFFLVL